MNLADAVLAIPTPGTPDDALTLATLLELRARALRDTAAAATTPFVGSVAGYVTIWPADEDGPAQIYHDDLWPTLDKARDAVAGSPNRGRLNIHPVGGAL